MFRVYGPATQRGRSEELAFTMEEYYTVAGPVSPGHKGGAIKVL